MSEDYNKGLFHKWMPGLGFLGLFVLFLAIVLLINPIYAGNINLMASATGIQSEYFMWGNFAAIIGMSLVLPFVLRIKHRFRSKELFITALVTMAVMSVVVATTRIGEMVVVACLIFGMAKMIGMVEMLLPFIGMVSPDGNRKRLYSILYSVTIGTSQIGTFYTAKFALNIGWQALHFYSAAILLSAALVCVIVMHNKRFSRKLPFYYIDWLGVLLFGTALMSMAYVFSFGRQQDWFNSQSIIYATIFTVLTIFALIIRQLNIRHPFLSFKLYRMKEVRFGLFLLVAQGMYMGASSILSIYTQATLGYNWITNASLSLMTLPGIVAAGFAAFHWTKHHLPVKMLVFSGFAAYFLFTVMLYFMMVPELNISQLYLPQLLNGYGMTALFSSIWMYTFDKVPQNDALPSVAPIMIFRSFIMMAFFTSFFGWLQYKFQVQSVGDMAVYFDSLNISHNPGVGAFRDVQMSAILTANKRLLGYIIIAGIGLLAFISFHSFGLRKYNYVRYKQHKLQRKLSDVGGAVPVVVPV